MNGKIDFEDRGEHVRLDDVYIMKRSIGWWKANPEEQELWVHVVGDETHYYDGDNSEEICVLLGKAMECER